VKTWVLGVAALLLAVGVNGQQQPVAYSHKTHVAQGLQCGSCHKNPEPGEVMGFPAESLCMGCHRTVKADSAEIRKVAEAAKEKKPVAWVRVYRLPAYVYFSHRVHGEGSVQCERCHGAVRERDVLTKEVEHTMKSCMACHEEMKAPNECGSCHEER
jgi:hypothetical protein